MATACEICTRTYNSAIFDSIDADSSDVEFQQIITFGCLSSLLIWAKSKHQLLKSSRSSESSDVGIPSLSSSSIVHIVRKIDTFGSHNKPLQTAMWCSRSLHFNQNTSPRFFDCRVAGLPMTAVVSNLAAGETNCKIKYMKQSYSQPWKNSICSAMQ